MEEFDDFLIGPQSDEYEDDWYNYSSEESRLDETPQRRKNEWKYANRRKKILMNEGSRLSKPLHFYAKNMPTSKAYDNRHIIRERRQRDKFKNQIKELFDEE